MGKEEEERGNLGQEQEYDLSIKQILELAGTKGDCDW